MIKKLKEFYFKEQFNPKFIAIFINPFYFARKGLYKNIYELRDYVKGKVLHDFYLDNIILAKKVKDV